MYCRYEREREHPKRRLEKFRLNMASKIDRTVRGERRNERERREKGKRWDQEREKNQEDEENQESLWPEWLGYINKREAWRSEGELRVQRGLMWGLGGEKETRLAFKV